MPRFSGQLFCDASFDGRETEGSLWTKIWSTNNGKCLGFISGLSGKELAHCPPSGAQSMFAQARSTRDNRT